MYLMLVYNQMKIPKEKHSNNTHLPTWTQSFLFMAWVKRRQEALSSPGMVALLQQYRNKSK